VQYAALPWRRARGEVEILLVTTRRTRRWIVPKGWPIPGCTPAQCAAHEAFEEAGIAGEIAEKPLGSFRYEKRRKSGELLPCKVDVFPLEVLRQRRTWPEKAARSTCWCSPEEALARVREPGLRRVIARFARSAGAAGQVEVAALR
jgi:8-oxo-dGTP pyrophosphatase MutT (NUDIX family)